MQLELRRWMLDQKTMRPVLAALVSIAAIGAFVLRDDDVVSWVFLGPTVFVFWAWALNHERRSGLVHLLGLTVPLILNIIESEDEVAMFISVVTTSIVAAWSPNRSYVRTVIGLYLFMMVMLGVVDAIDDFGWPLWLFGSVFAWGAGEVVWSFSGAITELAQTRSLVADQAILQERRRIARDVHDLVGHSLSVVMMHISGARLLVHRDPDEAERALEQAEEVGRQSLADIRRTVGLLRDDQDIELASLPSAELSDVPVLVADVVAAGQPVALTLDGDLECLDPAASLAGYRIVQEALTNAGRHSVGADIAVTIVTDDESCEITVTNAGGEIVDLAQGSGYGLISMRERAKSVGGSLVAGPTRDGWVVEASLPVRVRS